MRSPSITIKRLLFIELHAHAAGTRLGPYEIISALGAGGMGEVYSARDTRLDRMVAIKILFRGPGASGRSRRPVAPSPDGGATAGSSFTRRSDPATD